MLQNPKGRYYIGHTETLKHGRKAIAGQTISGPVDSFGILAEQIGAIRIVFVPNDPAS